MIGTGDPLYLHSSAKTRAPLQLCAIPYKMPADDLLHSVFLSSMLSINLVLHACTDHFSTDRMFYSNTSNQWLDAPNAALFGTRGNKPQNNTVSQPSMHLIIQLSLNQPHGTK